MTTPETPDEQRDETNGADADPISLNKDVETTVSVPRPEYGGPNQPAAPQPPTEAVYYSDQQSYPAQGYPAGDPAPQQGYPEPQQGYQAPPSYPTPTQAYGPAQAYGAPQSGYGAPQPYTDQYAAAYGSPGYSAYPARSSTNGMAIASLVVGVVGGVLTVCFFFFGVITGLVAIVLGAVALKQVNADPVPDGASKGMAIGGLVLGALQFIGAIAMIAIFVITLASS